jgi:hypothetical protein
MQAKTQDGVMITTIEQGGKWAGRDIGRLWIRDPQPLVDAWTIYIGFPRPAERQRAIEMAQGLTAAEFEALVDRGEM